MALGTLRKMAAGGMHDHLGGGFHRYSVDRFWHIPHFEKMLYDQAQLACSYLDALQITGDAAHGSVARDILDYVLRDMAHPEGGFYSAEDADSLLEHGKPEHGEGAFYVWSKERDRRALGEDAAKIFDRFYGVEPTATRPPAAIRRANSRQEHAHPADDAGRGGEVLSHSRGGARRRRSPRAAQKLSRNPQPPPAPAPR